MGVVLIVESERQEMEEIKCVLNTISSNESMKVEEDDLIKEFSIAQAEAIHDYHKSIPGYQPTPLRDLSKLAEKLKISKLWVKDESKRFDLNAFKVSGSSYAFARYLAGSGTEPLRFEDLIKKIDKNTFLVSATDGNHGYGVAFIAKLFNCKAKIVMPQGTVPHRAQRIRDFGAECDVLDVNYDACVEIAKSEAKQFGGLFIQDTALESDTEEERKTPLAIIQGYMTMLQEFVNQAPGAVPTHVFLQAGVGSFAGSMSAHLQHLYSPSPIIVSVEPSEADCMYKSAVAGDGVARTVDGEMASIMAGLCCGIPSVHGWPILRRTVKAFLSCEDSVTARGMRILYSPLHGDEKVVSGESGAVTLGALYSICTSEHLSGMREQLELNESSRVLIISTEGDTDPEGFFTSIWA